jgi:hypothetical protein
VSASEPVADLLLGQIDLLDAIPRTGSQGSAPGSADQARDLFERAANRFTRLLRDGVRWAYPYLRDANAQLGREVETEAGLRDYVRRNGELGARLMSYYCIEQIKDLACGLTVSDARVENGLLVSAGDSLEVAESNVLTARYGPAQVMLDPLLRTLDNACQAAVGQFYEFWIASVTDQREKASEAFARWSSAAQDMRQQYRGFCWVFEAAKSELGKQPPALSEADLLLDMIGAMEDVEVALPPRGVGE